MWKNASDAYIKRRKKYNENKAQQKSKTKKKIIKNILFLWTQKEKQVKMGNSYHSLDCV